MSLSCMDGILVIAIKVFLIELIIKNRAFV